MKWKIVAIRNKLLLFSNEKYFWILLLLVIDLRHSFEKSIKIDKISKEIGYHYILYIKVLKMSHVIFLVFDYY